MNTATGIWFLSFNKWGGPTQGIWFFPSTDGVYHTNSSPNKQIQHYFDLECSYGKMVRREGVRALTTGPTFNRNLEGGGKGPNHRSHIQ
jgi:hypothetical protein